MFSFPVMHFTQNVNANINTMHNYAHSAVKQHNITITYITLA